MRRWISGWTAPPVLVQVAALAAVAVIAAQAVTFALIVMAPEPRPAGFSVSAAAEALRGGEAETSDGRPLRRRMAGQPPSAPQTSPLETALAAALAERLDVEPDAVRVRLEAPRRDRFAPSLRGLSPGGGAQQRSESFVFVQRGEQEESSVVPALPSAEAPTEVHTEVRVVRQAEAGAPIRIERGGAGFTLLAEHLTFAPFTAAFQMEDGRWAVVSPPRGLLSPWQARILIGLLITLALLAPLVWIMARRLTRPIRLFADAAQRLGANPEAEPLTPSGPREVRTAMAAFNDMQDRIRRHVAERTQTIAAIAHDLRTPLTRLRFRAEQAAPAVRDRMAADIEEMDALIAHALAYARGEQEGRPHARLNLTRLARETVRDFAETGAAVSMTGRKAAEATGDAAALRRALANLIDNAVKFAGAARVRTQTGSGGVSVVIEDDGPGIPPDQVEALFEPFSRGERSRNRQTGGAGLGLAVARRIARAHGGEVTLETRPGGGLTARLTLPAARET
ncbi:MAG: two-component system OmpR family sensor kinase [Brevundimonas sp.]|jgi:two-component system OmpR family sensor kinase|uniref:ATP-binding protein n=1 Tax=Brevundimonas sp. TaxID=1871086 RepID=UPI0039E67FB5